MRNRPTYVFTFLFTLLLLLFAVCIYMYSMEARKAEFYKRVREKSIERANLLLDAKVSPEIFRLIYNNSRSDPYQQGFAIYDTMLNPFYQENRRSGYMIEIQSFAGEILRKGEVRFAQRNLQIDGFWHVRDGKSFFVVSAADDIQGKMELISLKRVLLIAFLIAGLITLFLVNRYSKMVIKRETHLSTQLIAPGSFLGGLNRSGRRRIRLVYSILLELRARLTAIAWTLGRRSGKAFYTRIGQRTSTETKRLEKGSSDDFIGQIPTEDLLIGNVIGEIRIDELLMDVKKVVEKTNRMKVNIIYASEIDNETSLLVMGDEYLLKVALTSLLVNRYQCSKVTCDIVISHFDRKIVLAFYCRRVVHPVEHASMLFKSEQSEDIEERGNRYGWHVSLSLVHSIMRLHRGKIDREYRSEKYTALTVTFMLDV